jgi:anaerobic ribonucleoside-triphosphate reductase
MPKQKKNASSVSKVPTIPTIIKRDGRIVPFDLAKITNAIWKGMNTVHEGSLEDAVIVAGQVFAEMLRIKRKFRNFLPTVEGTQDLVEQELMRADFVKTAKHYVLYREERAKIRAKVWKCRSTCAS